MKARFLKFLDDLRDTFWIIPACCVAAGALAAIALLSVDRFTEGGSELLPGALLYDGGASGARGLLSAVASSSITVAATVFSITIAALSLAAGQMGPRLLRSFTRDRGNQIVLGAFLGTFVYALLVLRSVRGSDEGDFIPHLSVSVALLLAIVCVGALVWYVDHMASRINVDTVLTLVSRDLEEAIDRLMSDDAADMPPLEDAPGATTAVRAKNSGYLQQLDAEGLATWAGENGVSIRVLFRPGAYVFPDVTVARVTGTADGISEAVTDAMAFGDHRSTSADLEQSVRQLVEVALRALSPGINDPHTAIGVLDQLGSALCRVAPRHFPSRVYERNGRITLQVPTFDYDGLVDAMFNAIRQNAADQPSVLIRLLEVLTAVADVETNVARRGGLLRHAELVRSDAKRAVFNETDLAAVFSRYATFERAIGPA